MSGYSLGERQADGCVFIWVVEEVGVPLSSQTNERFKFPHLFVYSSPGRDQLVGTDESHLVSDVVSSISKHTHTHASQYSHMVGFPSIIVSKHAGRRNGFELITAAISFKKGSKLSKFKLD